MFTFIRTTAIFVLFFSFLPHIVQCGENDGSFIVEKIKKAYFEKDWFHKNWNRIDEFLITARQLGLDATDPQTNCFETARKLIFLLINIDIKKENIPDSYPKFKGTLDIFLQRESLTDFKQPIANKLFLNREDIKFFYIYIKGKYYHHFVVERSAKGLILYHSWEDCFSLGEWLGLERPNRNQILPKKYWAFDKANLIPNDQLEEFMRFIAGESPDAIIEVHQF